MEKLKNGCGIWAIAGNKKVLIFVSLSPAILFESTSPLKQQ